MPNCRLGRVLVAGGLLALVLMMPVAVTDAIILYDYTHDVPPWVAASQVAPAVGVAGELIDIALASSFIPAIGWAVAAGAVLGFAA